MNLILLFPEDFLGDTRVRLSGRRFESIARIRGDELHVGLANGLMGTGHTVTRNADSVQGMLLAAKMMAIRDGVPTGVRLITDPNNPNNPASTTDDRPTLGRRN